MWQTILILVCALSTIGCSTFTPYTNVALKSDAVSDAGPLKSGSSRTDVIAVLGEPAYRSAEDREFGYLFAPRIGKEKGWLAGPCSRLIWGEREVSGMDDVWFAFDAGGLVTRTDKALVKKNEGDVAKAWQAFRDAK